MKKSIALFLVFSLLALMGNLYAKDRRGAQVVIEKMDGQQASGELIAVKEDSLLLLERYSGADVSVDLREIEVIKIKRKSGALLVGACCGLILGLGIGYSVSSSIEPERSIIDYEPYGIIIGALIGSFLGLAVGSVVAGVDKTIHIEGKSDSEIREILEKLRKKARVPDYP